MKKQRIIENNWKVKGCKFVEVHIDIDMAEQEWGMNGMGEGIGGGLWG